MVASGSVPANAPVWREGMADWQPFSSVLGGVPGMSGVVECAVCHQTFPTDQTIRYGAVNVCAGCKPQFVQGLREGAFTPGVMEWAGMGARIGAKILDTIILYAVNTGTNVALFGALAFAPSTDPKTMIATTGVMTLLNLIVHFTYNAVFLHWRGQTPGKIAMKIKVVTPEGHSLSWGKSIGRPLAEMLSGCTLLIGYLMAFWDPEKRTLHDRLAGTRVIKVGK